MSNQIVISSGAKVRSLEGVLTGTAGIVNALGINVANGIPQLDGSGKILVSQLPNSVMEYKGTWNAATNTPTLVNGTGNQGDVYLCNVAGTTDFGAGPITFFVGDQVIYSGTIWQRASGATGTVTSVAVTESGDALTITGSPITTSGTINIGFAGISGQYINGAGGLTTFPTLISSIGLSMPSAFSVANSPLTANGTIAVTGAGVASQYIRGDGTLANFPTSGGGGGSVSYYLNGSVNQGTFGGNTYYEMSKVPVIGAGTDFSINADGYISQFITDAGDPALLEIPAGNWNFEMYFSASSGGGTPSFYVELYKYNGSTFTLISSSSATPEGITGGTAIDLYTTALAVPTTALTLTDRLAVRVYVTHSGRTITLHTEDNHLCQVITTFSTGITALNGLTAQVQFFGTGTSGTDFNISSATATHTFNLPIASATNTGKLSSTDWSTFNSKQPAGNYVTLDTTQTITSVKTFDEGLSLKSGAFPTPATGYSSLGGNAFGITIITKQSSTIYTSNLGFPSANRTFTFPNADGTIALTTDISYPVTSVFGRTGAVVATEGDYSLTQLSDVTITSPTNGQVLKYNGTSWVNDTDANTGTVTSVDMSVPTGLSISGNPITTSGTLAVTFASGYSIPTTIKQSNWDDAYTFVAAFPTQTGNAGKYLTTNGSSLSWADNPLGTVTSVGLSSATSGVTIGSSPITTSGTITLSIATASGSQNGLLSSTDWTTFNNKANALSGTINTIAYWDSATTIASLALATYPSLTELSYVKGVTSAIQTQLNAKQGTLTLTTTGTSGAATLVGDTLNIPQYSGGGGGGMAIGGSITSATAGSVLFAGASGVLAQDNANFFWDDTNNRLGIGNATPLYPLDVYSTTNARLLITGTTNFSVFQAANTSGNIYCGIDDSTGASFIGSPYARFLFSSGAYPFIFAVNSQQAFRIFSNLNVFIGTATTNNGFKLEVSGTFKASGASIFSSTLGVGNPSGIGSTLQVNGNAAIGYSASTAAPTNGLLVSGSVGIGTTTVNATLSVGAPADTATSTQSLYVSGAKTGFATFSGLWQNQLFVYDNTATATGVGGAISFGGNAGGGQTTWLGSVEGYKENSTSGDYGGALVFRTRTNGSPTPAIKMFIGSTGNVGIGTTTIGSKLQVNGNAAIGYSASTAAPTNGLAVSGNTTIGGDTLIGTNNNPYKLTVALNGGAGYIGVTNQTGTTADRFLRMGFGTGQTYASIQGTRLNTADDVNIVMQGGGANVGIGTTTIGSTLQVNGNAAIGYSASTAAPTNGLAISGNVLVGTTSANSYGANVTSVQMNGVSGSLYETRHNGTSGLRVGSSSDHCYLLDPRNNDMRFSTFDTLRMTISGGGVVTIANLAGTGSRTVLADASGVLSAPVSDISVKQNITSIGYGLKEISKMNPVWFDFIDEYKNYGEGRQNGNIAQEMAEIIPEAVFTTPSTGKMGINYDQMHAVYIKAIQELEARIKQLENK